MAKKKKGGDSKKKGGKDSTGKDQEYERRLYDLNGQLDEKNAKIDELENQLHVAGHEIAHLRKQLGDSETPAGSSGEVAVCDVASCIGAIRERVNGYPLEDAEFHQIAPQLVHQAVALAYMVHDELVAYEQQLQTARDQEQALANQPAKEASPTLP